MLALFVAVLLLASIQRASSFRPGFSLPPAYRATTPFQQQQQRRQSLSTSLLAAAASAPFDVYPSFPVSNLAASVAFYENVLGMTRHSSAEGGDNNADTVAHLSFASNRAAGIELTQAAPGAAGAGALKRGQVFTGIGVTSLDAASIVRRAEQFGGKVVRAFDEYGYGAAIIPDEDELVVNPVKLGSVHDPDGYTVEVTEGMTAEPLRKVILQVLDTEETVAFYEGLGMRLHRRRSNINSRPRQASICSFLSFEAEESQGTLLELIYNYSVERLAKGPGVFLGISKNKAKSNAVEDPNGLPVSIC